MNLLRRLFDTPFKTKETFVKDVKDKVIPVIRVNGVQYYRYKDDLDMMYGRYLYLAAFLQAVELRMDLKTLNAYLEQFEKAISGGRGVVDIGKAHITLAQVKTRTKILFDEDLAYNLASCVFFTDSEPLNTYSVELNRKKIAGWREAGTLDFFMLEPIRALLGLTRLSITDLMTYLDQTRPIVEELNSAMQQAISNEESMR